GGECTIHLRRSLRVARWSGSPSQRPGCAGGTLRTADAGLLHARSRANRRRDPRPCCLVDQWGADAPITTILSSTDCVGNRRLVDCRRSGRAKRLLRSSTILLEFTLDKRVRT